MIENQDNISNMPFLFITGRPRSGTTLLMSLFDAHPNVSIPPECQFVVNLHSKYEHVKDWNKKIIDEFIEDLKIQWRFDFWKINLEQLKESLISYKGTTTYADVCKQVYLLNKSVFPKEKILLLGDKNPGYTIYTELLLRIFPNAKFIHIIRDYRDNLVSIRNVDFELPITSMVVYKWTYFIRKFRIAMKRNPNNHIEIRYEDLVTNPETEMKKLCDFAGIDYRKDVFNFHEKTDEVLKIYPKEIMIKYFSSLMNKVNTSRIGLWKKDLTDKQIKIADYVAGKYADKLNYKKKYTHFGLPIVIISLPGIVLAKMIYLATWIVDRFPYKLRMNIMTKWRIALARTFLKIFRPEKFKEIVKGGKQ